MEQSSTYPNHRPRPSLPVPLARNGSFTPKLTWGKRRHDSRTTDDRCGMFLDTLRTSKRIINSSQIGRNNWKRRWVTPRPMVVMEATRRAHYHRIGLRIAVPVSTIMSTKRFGQCVTTCGRTWFEFEMFSQMNGKLNERVLCWRIEIYICFLTVRTSCRTHYCRM